MRFAKTSRRPSSIRSACFCFLTVAGAILAAPTHVPAQDFYPSGMPDTMKLQPNPLQGQTVTAPATQQAPNPAQAPAPVIYNVQGPTTNASTSTPFSQEQYENLKNSIVTMPVPTPPSAANSTSTAPYSQPAPKYTTPNNHTFNNDGNNVAKMPSTTPAVSSKTTAPVPPVAPAASMPAVKATTPSTTTNLADFGVTRQDVAKVRTASTSTTTTPTSTDVWNATGKPINFVTPPANINATVANSTPRYLPRRQTGSYANQTDGSSEFAQQLGMAIFMGVLQGMASSGGGGGGGFHGGGGGGRIGGACSYWTTNVAACRAVR